MALVAVRSRCQRHRQMRALSWLVKLPWVLPRITIVELPQDVAFLVRDLHSNLLILAMALLLVRLPFATIFYWVAVLSVFMRMVRIVNMKRIGPFAMNMVSLLLKIVLNRMKIRAISLARVDLHMVVAVPRWMHLPCKI